MLTTYLLLTAAAARFSYEVASASARVAYMGGASTPDGDIARALGFRWTAEGTETLLLRSWVLLNVKAAGVMYPAVTATALTPTARQAFAVSIAYSAQMTGSL